MPRYLIHFERVEQTPGGPGRALGGAVGGFAGGFRLHDGRYALPPACPTPRGPSRAARRTTTSDRAPSFSARPRRDVGAREGGAAAVGAAFAPELYGSFAHLDGEVLCEMAHPAAPGERASLESIVAAAAPARRQPRRWRRRRPRRRRRRRRARRTLWRRRRRRRRRHALRGGRRRRRRRRGERRRRLRDDASCDREARAAGGGGGARGGLGALRREARALHALRQDWRVEARRLWSAHRAGERADHVAHSKRYCPPEVATAMMRGNGRADVRRAVARRGQRRLFYELFHGAPLLPADVDYTAIVGGVRPPAASLTDAIRLLQGAAPDAAARPSAEHLLAKHLFRPAQDTVERVEVAASSPTRGDLKLMREIQSLLSAFVDCRNRTGTRCPAARLSTSSGCSTLRCCRASSPSRATRGAATPFEADEGEGAGPWARRRRLHPAALPRPRAPPRRPLPQRVQDRADRLRDPPRAPAPRRRLLARPRAQRRRQHLLEGFYTRSPPRPTAASRAPSTPVAPRCCARVQGGRSGGLPPRADAPAQDRAAPNRRRACPGCNLRPRRGPPPRRRAVPARGDDTDEVS